MVGGLLCDVSVSNDADVAVAARMSGGGRDSRARGTSQLILCVTHISPTQPQTSHDETFISVATSSIQF